MWRLFVAGELPAPHGRAIIFRFIYRGYLSVRRSVSTVQAEHDQTSRAACVNTPQRIESAQIILSQVTFDVTLTDGYWEMFIRIVPCPAEAYTRVR